MEDSSTKGLKEERLRHQRVKRIKSVIVWTVTLWIITSMIICLALIFKVYSLERKMDYLLDNFTVSGQVTEEKMENQQSEVEEYSELEQYGTEEPYVVAQAINQKDNLAGPDDIHKVYLTFDDGPSSNTDKILDILKQYDVKATFFVIGKLDDESKARYQRIVSEGHTLGIHSYSHKYSSLYENLDGFVNDFSEMQNLLYKVTGQECLYYRFPGGSSNHVSNTDMSEFIKYLNSQGITYFDWNVSSGDATAMAYSPEELVANVMKDVVKYKTSVVLMHDAETKIKTVEALAPMIEQLQGMGAEILPIDDETTVIQHIAAADVTEQ